MSILKKEFVYNVILQIGAHTIQTTNWPDTSLANVKCVTKWECACEYSYQCILAWSVIGLYTLLCSNLLVQFFFHISFSSFSSFTLYHHTYIYAYKQNACIHHIAFWFSLILISNISKKLVHLQQREQRSSDALFTAATLLSPRHSTALYAYIV